MEIIDDLDTEYFQINESWWILTIERKKMKRLASNERESFITNFMLAVAGDGTAQS